MEYQSMDLSFQRDAISYGVSWWFALIGLVFLFIRPFVYLFKRQNFYTGFRK